MSKLRQKEDHFLSILLYITLGAVVLGGLAIWVGFFYFLFNVMLVGLFQVFVGLVAFAIFILLKKRKKAYESLNQLEEPEDATSDSSADGDAEEEQGKRRFLWIFPRRKKRVKNPMEGYKRYINIFYPLYLLVVSLIGLGALTFVYYMYQPLPMTGNLAIVMGMALGLLAFPYLLAANWFASETDFREGKMFSLFLRGAQWFALLSGVTLAIKGIKYPLLDNYLFYLLLIFMAVAMGELALGTLLRLFLGNRTETGVFRLFILNAFLSGGNPFTSFLESLEGETGISLRSLWALQFIRSITPTLILLIIILLWGMTAFVQIQADQQGVLYQFGQIQSEPLQPGLHLKWPWPVESVRAVPAFKIHTFTVGYETDTDRDFLWTKDHGGEEYKLLLGDGKELVSINMLVSYQIKDVLKYVTQYRNPEEKLKGEAYRILFQEIVPKNLDQLLSQDRASFAHYISDALQQASDHQELGLEVVNVALTNIHPPIELGEFYQDLVSAQIQKQILITKAHVDAEYQLPMAEREKYIQIKKAEVDATNRWAQGQSDVTKYLYQEEAYLLEPSLYKEWKWLEELEKALKQKKIYLLNEQEDIKSEFWLDMRTSTGKGE